MQTYMNLSEAFGIVVRERRRAMGLTQSELASMAGLHKNFIGMLERGTTSAGLESIGVIAAVLRCRPSQLLAAAERTRSTDES